MDDGQSEQNEERGLVDTFVNETLLPTWKESTFHKFTGLVVTKHPDRGTDIKYKFATVAEKKVVDINNPQLDTDGGMWEGSTVKRLSNLKEFLTDKKELEERLIGIVQMNGDPDETAKAIRAEQFYCDHEREPDIDLST